MVVSISGFNFWGHWDSLRTQDEKAQEQKENPHNQENSFAQEKQTYLSI